MKIVILFLTVWVPLCTTAAQTDAYFQQELDYHIRVTLDDRLHTLAGTLDLRYTNHAPDTLPFLWFHLWPNAYRNQTTAFARQQWRTAGTDFYFAKDSQLGYIDRLAFSVDGKAGRLEYHPDHPDLAKLWLPAPLSPGGTIRITTPFLVKIPDTFSRLGHIDQAYQITQWYPKPAVYDQHGWHPMPYLDQGEFYSEFGNYEVAITLPENYLIGATGSLQTASEKQFLRDRTTSTRHYLSQLPVSPNGDYTIEPFPASSSRMKTVSYTAQNVHDFAWFADKRYRVQSDTVLIAGKAVEIWTLFTTTEEQLWRHANDYVKRALQFYSQLVGPYPYPQMTVVQAPLGAGGGMEYPMLTVIDLAGNARNLDEVITHEVGHNWFYGVLASNERDHPWMDEGLNTFYEERYMQTFYPPSRQLIVPGFIVDPKGLDLPELIYLLQSRQRQDQAPDTPADRLSPTNYWLSAYMKPARSFWWLYHYWGQEQFDRAMQQFFREWQFRHPGPADLQESLASSSTKPLDWLFDGLLYSNRQMDYAVRQLVPAAAGYRLQLQNRGEIAAPAPIYGIRNNEVIYHTWIAGFEKKKTIEIPVDDLDEVILDLHHYTLDIDRKNNRIKGKGPFRKLSAFRMPFLTRVENEEHTSLYWLPTIGWNAYDGLQAGLLLHNHSLPFKQLEFDLMPVFGFKSGAVNGIGNIDIYHYPRRGLFREIQLGFNYRSFHFQTTGDERLRYERRQPDLQLTFRTSPATTFTHQLQYRLISLMKQRLLFQPEDGSMAMIRDRNWIHEWGYAGQNDRQLNPFRYRLALEHQAYTDDFERDQRYLKWSLEWHSQFHFHTDRAIHARLFVGGFLFNTRRRAGAIFPGAFSLIDQAATDYRFDDFYFGRSARDGWLSQQLTQRDGGFKTPVNPAFSLGKSNNFILAVNLKADWPFGQDVPIRPYLDLGYFDNAMPTGINASFSEQFLASGGIALEILNGRFGLYFPLVNTRNIQDRLSERGNFWQRIAFRFDLYGEGLRNIWQYE